MGVLNILDSSPPPFINLAPREVGEEPKAKNQNVGFSHCPLHPGTAAGPAGPRRSSKGSVLFPRWAPQLVPAYGGGAELTAF